MREILGNFNQNLLQIQLWETRAKTTDQGWSIGNDALHPWDAHQANRDLSWERDARDTTLAKEVAEAIAREMANTNMHYQALLNERGTPAMPTSLKMTSQALGFKVMDSFDWTKHKTIYQRWKMWAEKARHTLKAMEDD